jgi:hypothetical protein
MNIRRANCTHLFHNLPSFSAHYFKNMTEIVPLHSLTVCGFHSSELNTHTLQGNYSHCGNHTVSQYLNHLSELWQDRYHWSC